MQLLTHFTRRSAPVTRTVTARTRLLASGRARRLVTAIALVAGLGGSAMAIETPVASAATGTTTLSYTHPERLIQSTGNLYWTNDSASTIVQGGILREEYSAAVYRASKNNQPGQEQVLYQESQTGGFGTTRSVDFQDITYAEVGGIWYGYFVANYPFQNESQIKRVPLTGGPAVVLATSPAVIGNRDLLTDGSFLYWADAGGIRKMAIGGGSVQTLVSGGTFAHLGLNGSDLYYSSVNSILWTPTSGGPSTTVVSLPSAVTALHAPTQSDSNVYFGEANGEVGLFPGVYDDVLQLQTPSAGVNVTSVSVGSNYILWGESSPAGDRVEGWDNSSQLSSVTASAPPIDVQADGSAWYWGDVNLEKYTL